MNSSDKKIDWLSLVSLLVIVGGVCFLIFVGREIGLFKKTSKNNLKTDNSVKTVEIDKKYCDYAKKTLAWMDQKRDKNGKYFASVNCNSDKKICDKNIPAGLSGHDAVPAIWARYMYIKKTGDKSQIDQLKKDIDYYGGYMNDIANWEPVQNDFWNCKLLLEMNDVSVLEKSYVDKVQQLCLTSTYTGIEGINDGNDSTKIVYPDWKNLSENNKEASGLDDNVVPKYSSIITCPSDFVARYNLNKKQTDLDVANNYFNRLLTDYYTDNSNFSVTDKCLLAISSLDLYSVNKDSRYLDWAKKVYGDFFTKDGIKTEAFNPECAFLNRELEKYDSANMSNYQKNEKDLLDILIHRYWDGEGGKSALTGEGGFFEVITTNGFVYSKNLRENALMVNLLCN